MPAFLRLESMLEGLLEGGFRRLFPIALQPAEVARAVERVMLLNRMVGSAAVEVPNHFTVRLNPVDFTRLAARDGAVEREAAAYADRRASEEGLRPVGPIVVALVADPAVRRAVMRTQGEFRLGPALAPAVELTRRFTPVVDGPPPLTITTDDGKDLVVVGSVVHIGRAAANELSIRDLRVSRFHAILEPDGIGWVVRDVGSTNGTWLDGVKVERPTRVAVGQLSLGGYPLTIRVG